MDSWQEGPSAEKRAPFLCWPSTLCRSRPPVLGRLGCSLARLFSSPCLPCTALARNADVRLARRRAWCCSVVWRGAADDRLALCSQPR